MENPKLRHRLTVISAIVFILPALILGYIFFEGKETLKAFHIVLFAMIMMLGLGGIVLIRFIFDEVSHTAASLKRAADCGEKLSVDLQHEVTEMRDVSCSFNQLMERLDKATTALDRRVLELNSVRELTETAGRSLNMEELLQLLLDKAMLVTNALIGSIFVIENADNRFRLVAAKGFKHFDNDYSVDIYESMMKTVAFDKKTLIVHDIENDPRTRKANDPRYGSPSFMSMPILRGPELIAVINLAHKENDDLFNADDEHIMSIMLGEMGFALENARLHAKAASDLQDLEEKNSRLEQEIAERRRAENELRESRKRLSEIIEFLPDATLIVDNDGKVVGWNRAMAILTGVNAQEMLGKGNYEYALPFYNERRPILIDLALHPDPTMEREYTTLHRLGSILFGEAYTPGLPRSVGSHLSATASVLRDSQGNITGAIECIRDNTEHRQLEDKLLRSEQKYRRLVDNSPVGVFQTAIDGEILFANQEFAGMFDFDTIEELKAHNVAELYKNREDRKTFLEMIKSAGKLKNYELELNTRTGQGRNVLLNGILEGDRITGTLMDITDRKIMLEERQRLAERLHRAEKMEALGTLAGGVAHDLNNVLGVLVGYSELMLDKISEDHPLRRYVTNMLKSGEKAAAIIQDLLTLARRGVAISEVVNLNAIITDYLRTPEFEKLKEYHSHVFIRTDLSIDLMNIKGSPIHLGKTVMNLVSNAVEAMEEQGEVVILTENRYLDQPLRGYDDIREGDYVVLSVSDTGNGIASEDLAKIFEPFYTKKVMGRSGTGLGLAVVWGTVKDHEGYIDVRSEAGTGSSFTLYFPVTREAAAAVQTETSFTSFLGKGETIMVIDDVREQREVAENMLRRLGYEVVKAASGEEAVACLGNRRVDLLLLDMIMDPGIDGLETYQRIIKIHPGQKAVLVSGFSETERVKKTLELGAGAYVRKPYTLEKIGMAIANVLAS